MAMGQHCPVLQVVGFQGSGKTTLMEKLIQRAARYGMKPAALKHHGHAEPLKPPDSRPKDNMRHHQAGAFLTAASGAGQLQMDADTSRTLPELLAFYQFFEPGIIFVEGYKQESYPKVVLLRNSSDRSLLHECSRIICVITPDSLEEDTDIPCFLPHDEEHYLPFILNEMEVPDNYGSL
ncbi:molybdopterin-guanine dinucleotide biosynthesis protein B [Salibacterium lacus]|uniref:Molybdopterin-guanine dinucleotide biosynthesis protein B n=1 Tax=Salibacterium lacus TaxID=1898109 RepID=A0ABW5T107_9BACI